MRLAFDIETDGLLEGLTTIHSLCIADVDTGRAWSCTDHPGYVSPSDHEVVSIDEGLALLMEADEIIGHNIIKFDIPAIQKVKPQFSVRRQAVTDTLIISRLIWPELREQDFALRNKYRGLVDLRVKKELKRLEEEYEAALCFHIEALDAWAADEDTEELAPDPPQPPEYDRDALFKQFMNEVLPGHLIGSHGLEAWGYRLGEWKGDYSKEMKAKGLDPWANWNTEMQEYCEQDVVVTLKLLQLEESKKYAAHALEIERDFAWVIAEMERNGFPFAKDKAEKLQGRLMRRQAEIIGDLQEAFPPIHEEWDFTPKANNSKLGYKKGETIRKSKEIIFNPGSRDHIAKWLRKKYGWKPEVFTETGKPMIDETILKNLPYPEAKLLAEYFLLDKRLGMLEGKGGKGLIPYAVMHDDGVWRIHGSVMTNGAVTRRCTHSKPNMAQLPAVNVPFGKDFRELMCAFDDYVLMGWDASGLELRCFAHYMAVFDNGQYTGIVLDGDIHWKHVIALGLFPEGTEYDEHNDAHNHARNKVAKRFIYAYLYGAGAEKIGEIVKPEGTAGQKVAAGRRLIREFLKRTPALKRLKEVLAKRIEQNGMTITAIDGGRIHVRSPHSALNTLLQSAGAIAVKLATIMFYDLMVERGLVPGVDFMIVAHVHDEVQTLVKKGKEEVAGKAAIDAIRKAGEALGFKCPLDGEYKVGANWAETH